MIMIEVSTDSGCTWIEVDFFNRSIFTPCSEGIGEFFYLSGGWTPCIWRYKK